MRDYKGRRVSAGARWTEDRRLQVALYAIAVRELLELEPVGALYQPVGARDVRARGIVRDDVPGAYVNGDVLDAEAFDAALEEARDDRHASGERPAGRPDPRVSGLVPAAGRLRLPGHLPRRARRPA